MARLAENEIVRCMCDKAPLNSPVRCRWRATGEDRLCQGCRDLCGKGVGVALEAHAALWADLCAGGTYMGTDFKAPHLVAPDGDHR